MMKFAKVLFFVSLVQLSLITSLAIKSPNEKPKEANTHNDNAVSLAQAVQKLQAMRLADNKLKTIHHKTEEKQPIEKVLPETTMATFTGIYLLDTTLISQPESQLIKKGHISARGEAILNQLVDYETSVMDSDTEDVAVDQTSDGEIETRLDLPKNIPAKNQDVIKDTPELHRQPDFMNSKETVPDTSQVNKLKPEIKTEMHPHSSILGSSQAAKETKHNHSVQNSKTSDHIMSTKPKVAQSSNHHIVEPHTKVATDKHVSDESDFENTGKSKLTKEDMKTHVSSVAASKIFSSKVNDQQNTPKFKSDSSHHQASITHRKTNLPVSSHNSVNHRQKLKTEKVIHEIAPKKVSQPKLSDTDTSQEDTGSVDSSKGNIKEIDDSKVESELTDDSKDDTELTGDPKMIDDSKLTDDSKSDSELIDNSIAESELIDDSIEGSEVIDTLKEDTKLKESSEEDTSLTNPLASSAENDKKINTLDDSSLNVSSDTEKKGVPVTGNNSMKLSNPEKKTTEDIKNNKINNADPKPLHNHPKKLERKPPLRKPVHKYHPIKLPHKANDIKSKNLDNTNIEVDHKTAIDESKKSNDEETLIQKPVSESPNPKHPVKIDPLMQKTELKLTSLHDDLKSKENNEISGKEKTNNKNQEKKDVLKYLKHESQMSHQKKSVSSNYILAVSLILIISVILFAIVGIYYRQIRIDRQKYIGHMLLETAEDDEDMQLFNRQTYHDEENHGYESWNAIR